jgi:hypothetical protein
MEEDMSFRNAKGEGKFGAIVGIVVLVLAIYMIVSAGPVYLADFQLQDRMETAALGPPTPQGNTAAHKKIMIAIEDLELQDYLGPMDVRVIMASGKRKIDCSYQREVTFLPGFKRTITFTHKVDQPVF